MLSVKLFYGNKVRQGHHVQARRLGAVMDCDIDEDNNVILLPDADVSEPEIDSDESDFEEEVTDDEQDEQDTTEREEDKQAGSKSITNEREAKKKLESKKKTAKKYQWKESTPHTKPIEFFG